MKIEDNRVITIHYSVHTQEGLEIDSSRGKAPVSFIQGSKFMIEGLEEALYDKKEGDSFKVEVAPEKAYGTYQTQLVQEVPIEMFSGMEIEIGMSFRATTEEGEQSVIVTDKDDSHVTVDGNHPLAGHTLIFDVEVVEVREAKGKELEHGLDCEKRCCD